MLIKVRDGLYLNPEHIVSIYETDELNNSKIYIVKSTNDENEVTEEELQFILENIDCKENTNANTRN